MIRRLTRVRLLLATLPLLAAASAAPARAQAPSIGFSAGDSVVLAAPRWLRARGRGGLMGLGEKYAVEIGMQNGVAVARDSSGAALPYWRGMGFPNASAFRIREIKTVSGSGGRRMVQVTLRTRGELGVEVLAPVGEEAAFAEFLAPAAQADSLRAASYQAVGDAFFGGTLASTPPALRTAILAWADSVAQIAQPVHVTYRNGEYMMVRLWNDGTVWNDMVIRRPTRLARILNGAFPMLKRYGRVAGRSPLAGVLLTSYTCHGTAPNYGDQRCDTLFAYLSGDALRLFANDEITAQDLLNRSILLENDMRMQLDLSDS